MQTGLIYDELMTEHVCLWDPNHNEKPERFIRILKRCEELGLLKRCERIPSRKATRLELEKLHSPDIVDLLESTAHMADISRLEELSSKYDFLYIHPSTYELSLLAAGSSIELVSNILEGKVKNGIAIIRPPGHHAMKVEYCGYCFFNNVALAAQEAIDRGLKRILIVDWDIHHGQASQQMFYEDPRVLYFSIHGYQNGLFWPHLRESDYHYIGRGSGRGFNINVPLNKVGMRNQDYLAIFQQLLLPIAHEYNPELVLVSAGYDAALGCPEGEMEITPACYSHFTSSLMGLAGGKIAVFLEGGYCLKSLAESAAMTLRTLLGDPCPAIDSLIEPCQSVKDSILSVSYVLRNHWKCLDHYESFDVDSKSCPEKFSDGFWPRIEFGGIDEKPAKYPTRGICPAQDPKIAKDLDNRLEILIKQTALDVPIHRVGLAFETDLSYLDSYKLPDECCIFRGKLQESIPSCRALSELIDALLDENCRSGIVAAPNISRMLSEVYQHATEKREINRILLVDMRKRNENLSDVQDSRLLHIKVHHRDIDSAGSSGSNAIYFNLPEVDDTSILAALFRLLMPIAYQYNPQLVFFMASATSDATLHVLHQLTVLARGHVMVFTEEDQLQANLHSLLQTLLGNPLPSLLLPAEENRTAIREAVKRAIETLKSSWSALAFDVKLPKQNVLVSPWIEDARHAKFNPEIEYFLK